MYFSSWLSNIPLVCINLKIRHKKRKIIKQHINNRFGKFRFFYAKKHKNPKRGCLESHLQVIREAVQRGDKAICILEDDAKFIGSTTNLPPAPKNWDMLYLGGTVKDVYGKLEDQDGNVNPWVKMRCWTTHAYILNLENPELIAKIMKLEDYQQEIDRYYLNKIHPSFNCYMANPMLCIQRPGYSDIEECEVSYDFMKDTLKTFRKPDHDEIDGAYVMKLPEIPEEDLPYVSIITPTYNRRKLFALAQRNFREQDYPAHKLEWVIIDDSDDPDLSIDNFQTDLVSTSDPRINYIKLSPGKERLSVAYKRNLGVKAAKYNIIVHMDDDDYYPPSSVIARVKLLLKHSREIGCVGCSSIGIYDLIHDASSICSDGTLTLSEASMAYTRAFWEEQPFNALEYKGEYFSFIKDRLDKVLDIPYSFVIYALTHKTNLTDKLRRVKESQTRLRGTDKKVNFIDSCWDEDTEFFIRNLANYLKQPSFSVDLDS